MSMFEISRAQGAGASEAVEPGMSVVVNSGDRILCDQSFTEVSSITRIDNNLQLIVADNLPTVFNQFFSAKNSLIQFQDQQFTNDDLNNILSVHLTSTDSDQTSHEIFLSLGSAVLAQPGDNYYLNAKEFDVKDLHRHGEDLMIQSHDETEKTIAVLKGFFSKPEAGFELPQLHITDPAAGETQDMIVHPHSNIFQWEGEPLPIAVIGSLYGYYFNLQGADADKFVLVAKSADGELPPWMSFAHVGEGKYYLAGVPTPGSVGSTEIVINAYSIQNKIGFHTTQSFQLQIKSVDDTVTRPTIDDIATAEYRSLSETVTADSFVTSVIAIDQMAYMSMPEIAVITGLAAVNPMTFAQTFSSYSTPEQIQAAKELSDQSKLSANQAIHTEDLVNHVVVSGHAQGEVPHAEVHGLIPATMVPATATSTTSSTQTTSGTTPGSSSQTQSTPAATTPTSTSSSTPMMFEMIQAPTNSSASNHALLTILSTPTAPTLSTLQSYLDGVHGVTLDGDVFFSFYPGTLGTSAFIIPNATGNGYGALVDASTSGRFGGASLGDVYYLHGQATFPTEFHISDAGVTGTVFYPPSGQILFPTQIYNASDFNGDGSTDMLFVAYTSQGFTSYIVFGTPSGFPSTTNLGNLVSSGGAEAITTSSHTFSNGGVLGDVNGSGLSSVGLVVSYGATSTTAYVIFGNSTPPSSLDVSALNGVNGFTITAAGRFALGQSNTIMGIDINGDGFNDIAFKTYHNFTGNPVTMVLGDSLGFPSTFDIGNVGLAGQPAGFNIYNSADSTSYSHHFGNIMANIGNFTGSGIDDLVINETNPFTSNSTTYVIFGSHSFANNTNFDVVSLNGSNGFELTSTAPHHYITSIAYLGDVNGDGIPDFGFIDKSAYGGQGAAYIIFGSKSAFPAVIDYTHLSPSQGLVIQFTPGVSATTISGGGDLNGDGLADIVLSNPTTSVGTPPAYGASGVSYIVFGGNFTGAITQMGVDSVFLLQGTGANDVIFAGAADHLINMGSGNTFVNTGAGHDSVHGGSGINTVVYSALDGDVYGGSGTSNTLWFQNDGTHVTFTVATHFVGFDIINLRPMQDMVGNSASIDAATVGIMSNNNTITMNGDAHDIVTLTATDMWTASSALSGYTTYTSMSGAVVNVQNAVHVTFDPPATPVTLDYTIASLTDGVHGFELTHTTLLNATSSTIVQNGDGFGDLLIANGFSAGSSPFTRAFIVDGQATFGASVPFNDPSLTVSEFNNTSFGSPISAYGQHVNSIGDFNGDGINDILVSEFFGGYSHVILGQVTGFPSTSLIATVGINLPGHYNATTSAALGDVNGDGLSDFALSDSQSGWGAVIFGTTTPGSSITTSILTGANGFQISRPSSDIPAGLQDMGSVDISGDGKNDILVSYYNTTTQIGSIGVILGNTPVFSPTVTVSSAGISGANGFLITNSAGIPGPTDYLINPTDIGNFTGNGVDSLAFSSQNTVYVLFGSTTFNTASNFDVSSLNGTNGFELTSSGAANITSIAYLGDVNGDGLPDFAFLDSAAYGGKGAVYVIFGNTSGFPADINYTNLNSSEGFVITDPSGFTSNQTVAGILGEPTVSGGGDLNGSGLGDIVITSGSNQYVVYGQNFNGAITQLGGPNPSGDPNNSVIQGVGSHDVIYAGSANHTIIGGPGFTFIDSGTGHDIINGGPGINTIVYSTYDTSVDAGIGGPNTLWLENDGIIANLQNTTIFKDFDVIDLRPLRSLQGNEVDLNPQGVANMSHHDTLQVEGGAHDNLVLHNSGTDVWSAGPVVNLGGFLYTTYTSAVTHSTVYAENTLHHVSIV